MIISKQNFQKPSTFNLWSNNNGCFVRICGPREIKREITWIKSNYWLIFSHHNDQPCLATLTQLLLAYRILILVNPVCSPFTLYNLFHSTIERPKSLLVWFQNNDWWSISTRLYMRNITFTFKTISLNIVLGKPAD